MKILKTMILLVTLAYAGIASAEVRLMMVESDSCPWCARWHKQIGPAYPNSSEGKIAPLLPQDIHDPMPEGVELVSEPQFTPTFILLVDGKEVNRLEGYPGPDFFWGLLDKMLAELPADADQTDGS